MKRLQGKTALVTGGGMGIGEGIARTLASEGASVVVADINESAAVQVVESILSGGGEARFALVDVKEEATLAAAIRDAGDGRGLDILVNNAAIALPGRDDLLKLELELWEEILSVNMRSVFLGMKHAIPQMMRGGGGSIISIGSIGALSGAGGTFAYGATKAAIMKMTMSAASRFARDNIRVNAVAPGMILTPLSRKMMKDKTEDEVEAVFKKFQPLPRSGRPEDIANAVLFFASDDSAFVTGQTLVVDGGMIMAGWGKVMNRGFDHRD